VQYLDLTTDDPDDYEGRVVVWEGAEYIIGPLVAYGGERIVHELANRRSGLSLHFIKILIDQSNAEETWSRVVGGYRQLREMGADTGLDPELVHAHGGYFELDEAATDEVGATGELMKQAIAQSEQGADDEAEALYNKVLAANPFHTEALSFLAMIYARKGDTATAVSQGLKIVSIEPNIRPYRVNLMTWCAELGYVSMFLPLLNQWQQKWPGDYRINPLAARVLIAVGRPDEASLLKISASDTDPDLSERIRQETAALDEARQYLAAAYFAFERDSADEVLMNLKQAYSCYDKNPIVGINYALALSRTGKWQEAHSILSRFALAVERELREVCLVNMAFALARRHDYPAAAQLLTDVAAYLIAVSSGDSIHYWDLPGPALWVLEGGGVIQLRPHTARGLMNEILEAAEAEGVSTSELCLLVRSYDQDPPPDAEAPQTG
jgi:tetratricopeptide (TPR) repeat protein